ncbi:hypothetical protein WS46_00950 [Burkholderia sp. RF4-BP95]|nr:hypothetical protein WS46_00950 [Burkholderia sp. RF4-BP95]
MGGQDAVHTGQHASVRQAHVQLPIQRGQVDAQRSEIEARPGDIDESQLLSHVAGPKTLYRRDT